MSIYKWFFFLVLILWFSVSELSAQRIEVHPFERYTRIGDNPEWAKKDFEIDTAKWILWGNLFEPSLYWVRYKIRCEEYCRNFTNPGLEILSLGSYEMYWDGQLLASNGKVGKNRSEEIPGRLRTHIVSAG